jgi:hypothetical protein
MEKTIRRLKKLGRGDDLRIEGIPNGRQIRFKADFWRVGFVRAAMADVSLTRCCG